MRLLYYNWVDPYDAEGRGGGVSLYQRTLLETIAGQAGVEATFLSAGLAHGVRAGAPRWERVRSGAGPGRVRRFRMVDSRPLSPSHHSFGTPEQVTHPPTEEAFARFVEEEGPFDVLHFNNLEGLPAGVLAQCRRWAATRVVVSLHNFYPFCPQVNLWRQERAHCADYEGGAACRDCLPFRPEPAQVRRGHAAVRVLEGVGLAPGSAGYVHVAGPALRGAARAVRRVATRRRTGPPAGAAPAVGSAEDFAARRKAFVDALNAHADRVLAVSERTAEIARDFGVAPGLLEVVRIGTDQSGHWQTRPAPRGLPRADGTLGLGYLGYMRRDKGFYFLLDALERMAPEILARLRLTIAAQARDAGSRARLSALAPRLAGFRHVDGYARDALDDILAEVDLGLVPVLWEDTAPQVALEMHARRIPLLTSDRGGARELGAFPGLVVPAGDAAALEAKLREILDAGLDLGPYWAGALPPTSPEAHVGALLDLYRTL